MQSTADLIVATVVVAKSDETFGMEKLLMTNFFLAPAAFIEAGRGGEERDWESKKVRLRIRKEAASASLDGWMDRRNFGRMDRQGDCRAHISVHAEA